MMPTYELLNESYEVNNKMVHLAKLTCKCSRNDLKLLIGTKINSKEEIIGVESFAVENQSYKNIGLMTRSVTASSPKRE